MKHQTKTVAFFVLIGLWLSASVAQAGTPTEIWLSLGEDASRQMVVSFRSDMQNENATVEYGIASVAEHSEPVTFMETFGEPIGYAYHTYLENLQAGKTYQYRIKVGDQFTDTFSFKTAPVDPCAPVQFIAMGDNRSQLGGSAYGDAFLRAASETGATFMLNSGDLVKDGVEASGWVDYLFETSGIGRSVPVMPSIGNHDDGPGSGNDQYITKLFHVPSNGIEGMRSHYAFSYGNVFFAVLTNHDGDAQQQSEWLDAQLEASEADWKFVVIHEPFFTCPALFGLLGHEADEKKVGQYYLSIFARHHVDMVFTGHNHMYELFNPHDGEKFVTDPSQGTLHITTGGAAEGEAAAMLIEPALMCTGRINQSNNIHFLSIRIIGGDLVMEYYPRGRTGNNPGEPEFHYGIHKNLGLDCSVVSEDGDDVDGDMIDGDVDAEDEHEQEAPVDGDEDTDPPVVDGDDQPVVDGDEAVICKPDDFDCRDNMVVKCNRVGTNWVELQDCGEKRCEDGQCVDPSVPVDPDGDISIDGDSSVAQPDADGNGGGGCAQANNEAGTVLLSMLALALAWARRHKESYGHTSLNK
jgi:hypothetical protein